MVSNMVSAFAEGRSTSSKSQSTLALRNVVTKLLEKNNSQESLKQSDNTEAHDYRTNALIIMAAKLKKNKKFKSFFVNMAEEGTIALFCKLNKLQYKQLLTKRYNQKLTERIVKFVDINVGQLGRKTLEGYIHIISDFIKGGKPLWQKFAYFIFNISGNEKLCDHDMF